MLPANKIHLLLSASIAFVVVLNSQSAFSIDLNQHRRQNIDKEKYSSYDRLNGRQLKGSNKVDSENENDVIDDNRIQSIDASNNIEEDKTTSGRTLRGGGFIRNFQEKVQNAKGQEQEQKAARAKPKAEADHEDKVKVKELQTGLRLIAEGAVVNAEDARKRNPNRM